MKLPRLIKRSLLLLPMLCALPLSAATYDAVTDFSKTTNTNTSLWSYRYKPNLVRDGNYLLLPGYGPADATWSPSNPGAWTLSGSVPEIGVNKTGGNVTYTGGPAFLWPNETMLVHPGIGQLAVLSWLSPQTMLVDISFSFTDMDAADGDGIAWFVEKNNFSSTLSSGAFGNGGFSGVQSLDNVAVNAGDRISFIVSPNGSYFYDSTNLTAMIVPDAAVPEPSTAMAGTLTLFAALWWHKRRRRLA